MKKKAPLICFFCIAIASCSTTKPKGEVVSYNESQFFHAKVNGPKLKIGDRVSILKYEDFNENLKTHQSKSNPIVKKKVLLGVGKVSSILKDNYYEIKSDEPKNIPEGSIIEKL